MAICVVCKEEAISANDVKCSGGCNSYIHALCLKNAEGMKTRSGKEWKCLECRMQSSSSVKSGASSTSSISKDFLINVMEGFKNEVFNEIKQFRNEMLELSKSVQFISDKLDTSNTMMEEIKNQFSMLKKENDELRKKNAIVSSEVIELRERLRNLEQYSRKNNVEVSGVPATRGESVKDLVMDVGAAIGVVMQESDVASAHRVPTYKKDREPSLIIQFNSRSKREEWLSKYRAKKQLTAMEINKNFPSRRVFINSHLSPENKQFLAKLKLKCREVGYSFAWCRDDKFFARKSPEENAIKINSYADIDKLK